MNKRKYPPLDTVCTLDVETVSSKNGEKIYSIGVVVGGTKDYNYVLNSNVTLEKIYKEVRKYDKLGFNEKLRYFSDIRLKTKKTKYKIILIL